MALHPIGEEPPEVVIEQGLESGQGPAQVAEHVVTVFGGKDGPRGRIIARTPSQQV